MNLFCCTLFFYFNIFYFILNFDYKYITAHIIFKLSYWTVTNNSSFSQNDIQKLMPSCEDINCNCPNCNARSNFSFHGSYNRNISFICEDRIYDFKVIVTRVICNSCGATHSLLPSFIVPYKIFSCDSILNVVSEVSTTSVIKFFIYHLLNIYINFTFKYWFIF